MGSILILRIRCGQVYGIRRVIRIHTLIAAAEHEIRITALKEAYGFIHSFLRTGSSYLLVQIHHLYPALFKTGRDIRTVYISRRYGFYLLIGH